MRTVADTIFEEARKHQISPQLIAAIIHTESGGHIWASRYEQKFFYKYISNVEPDNLGGYWPPESLVSGDTERAYRSMSLGLMQVMGQKAREYGYKGVYLSEFLVNPELSIEFGCLILADCIDKAKGDIKKALLKYNGGGDKEYPNRVLSNLDSGNGHYLLVSNARREPGYTQ